MIGPTLNNKPARLSSPPQEEELNPRILSSPFPFLRKWVWIARLGPGVRLMIAILYNEYT